MNGSACPEFFIPVVNMKPLAVQEEFQLLSADSAERLVVIHVAQVHRPDFDFVLCIRRKLVRHDNSAARPEGQPFQVVILRRIFRHVIGRLGLRSHITDGGARNLARSGPVGLNQCR